MINTSKDFYSTQELAKEPWFPIKSTITLKKLVEKGILEGIDISTNSKYKRYRITKKSIIEFLVNQTKKAENLKK